MHDLTIVHPGAAHGIYGKLGDDLVAVEPPLWARIIAGCARDAGFSVQIIDAEAEKLSPEDVARIIDVRRSRLVCIACYGHQPSASTQQMHGAGATAEAIKRRIYEYVPIIMVGGHVSALPARTMNEFAINYVAEGEGPATVVGLLNGDPEHHIPGLWYRAAPGEKHLKGGLDSNLRNNPPAPLVRDLKRYHGNAWDLLPMKKYRAHNWQCFGDLGARQPYASIYTSLGCPYECSFCCINAPFGTNGYRMRDPADVVQEAVDLWSIYGVSTFKIVDEMFVLNERHYVAIAEGLVAAIADERLPPDLNIWAYSRVDTVKAGHLPLLRRAGFRWLALGIESASAYVRDGAEKKMRQVDIAETVHAIQAAGISVIANYIFGLPDDDMRTMNETLSMALSLNTEFANFYSAMAYPGSKLYDEATIRNATLPETWRGYSQHNEDCRPLDTNHVSGADVLRFRDAAFQIYFRSPRYRAMVAQKFGQETIEHIDRMLSYKLKRRLLEGDEAQQQPTQENPPHGP